MNAGNLSHKFIIATNGEMYAYVMLKTPQGAYTTYFYDALNMKRSLPLVIGTAVLAVVGFNTYPDMPMIDVIRPLVGMGLISAIGADIGVVRRTCKRKDASIEQVFDITPERYAQLRKKLNRLARRKMHGIYSMPFNNCAGFALRFARDNGFDMPKIPFANPQKLARVIEMKRHGGVNACAPA